MKKQYINPTMEIIDVEMEQQLLAGSVSAPFGDGTMDGGDAAAPEYEGPEFGEWRF